MVVRALILAGGRGRRLAPLTDNIPKEMVEVRGKPVIEHLVEAVAAAGIRELQVVISREKTSIVERLGSGARYGVEISYRVQDVPLGTADAVAVCRDFTGEDVFLVAYGDTFSESKTVIKELVEAFSQNSPDVMLAVQRVENVDGFGLVKLGKENQILEVFEKPTREEAEHYRTKDGLYAIRGFLMFQPYLMQYICDTKPGINGEKWLTDSVKNALKNGLRVETYLTSARILDIGTHQALKEAQNQSLQAKSQQIRQHNEEA